MRDKGDKGESDEGREGERESRGMERGERRVEGERGEREMTCRREVPLRAALTFKVLHSLSLCLRPSIAVRYLSTGAPLCAPKHTHTHTSPHPSSALLGRL